MSAIPGLVFAVYAMGVMGYFLNAIFHDFPFSGYGTIVFVCLWPIWFVIGLWRGLKEVWRNY